jgi:hypothetical protein
VVGVVKMGEDHLLVTDVLIAYILTCSIHELDLISMNHTFDMLFA